MQGETLSLWWIELGIGLFFFLLLNYLLKQIVVRIERRFPSEKSSLKGRLLSIFFFPVRALLWVLALLFLIEMVSKYYPVPVVSTHLDPLRSSAIMLCLGIIFLRWSKALEHSSFTRHVDASFAKLWAKIATVAIGMLLAMILLQLWGINIGPLIAFGGVGAAAVGFASKDVISNFCGGVMLSITRPFVEGDLIVLSALKIEGHVEQIGWYSTAIRDRDKRSVYLPNSIFSNTTVVNSTRMTHRHIEGKIGIRYEDAEKISSVVEKIKERLKGHPKIDDTLPVLVSFVGFGDHSLDIEINVYTSVTKLEQYVETRQEILLLAYQMLLAEGIQLATPQLELSQSSSIPRSI